MTRRYHRQPRHDYIVADKMFAEMSQKQVTRTAKCRRIAKVTGIHWSTLYARYFTNKWRHRQVCSAMVQTIEPARIDYRERLERVKAFITARTGIRDFRSPEGQRELAKMAAKQNCHFTNGYEEANYYAVD